MSKSPCSSNSNFYFLPTWSQSSLSLTILSYSFILDQLFYLCLFFPHLVKLLFPLYLTWEVSSFVLCSGVVIESTGRIAEIKYSGTTLRGCSMPCLRTTPSLQPGAEKDSGVVCENVICVFHWGNLGVSTMHFTQLYQSPMI